MKGKHKIPFFNVLLNYKIEKLREIEHLCSAIMNVLEIAEKPYMAFVGLPHQEKN